MYHIFLNMVWSIWYGSFNMANVHNYFTLIFINLLCLKNFKLKYIFEYWFPVINFYENKKSNKPNRFGHLISPTWLFIGHNISKQYLSIDIIYSVLVPDAISSPTSVANIDVRVDIEWRRNPDTEVFIDIQARFDCLLWIIKWRLVICI